MSVVIKNSQGLERWFTVKGTQYQYLVRYVPRERSAMIISEINDQILDEQIPAARFNAELAGRIIKDWKGHEEPFSVDALYEKLLGDDSGDFHSHCESILGLCGDVSHFRDRDILLKNSPMPSNGSLTMPAQIMSAA